MDIQVFWFSLIVIFFVGFFFLEGFDYGVGIWLPFVARRDSSRQLVVNSIGSVWNGNEVWMVGAGGAIFAAFPLWYATMFSSFYFALMLILFAIALRGLGIEFRGKSKYRMWRYACDSAFFLGSFLLAFLWGVFVGNMIRGLPINSKMVYVGNFGDLLNTYSLLCGLLFVLLFTLHGGLYLRLKIKRKHLITQVINRKLPQLHRVTCIVFFGFLLFTCWETDILGDCYGLTVAAISFIALILSGIKIKSFQKISFFFTSVSVIFLTLTLFVHNYPNVMISSLNSNWNLTIYNSCSSLYSLQIMRIVAFIFVPIIIIYQIFAHMAFRKRKSEKDLG